jgi:hypothetical protein
MRGRYIVTYVLVLKESSFRVSIYWYIHTIVHSFINQVSFRVFFCCLQFRCRKLLSKPDYVLFICSGCESDGVWSRSKFAILVDDMISKFFGESTSCCEGIIIHQYTHPEVSGLLPWPRHGVSNRVQEADTAPSWRISRRKHVRLVQQPQNLGFE